MYTHFPQSEHTCNMLIHIFNQVPNFHYQSGCYDTSFLPHAKFMHSDHSATAADLASSPEEGRRKCQSQHTLICFNLGLNKAPSILSLDSPVHFDTTPDICFPEHIVALMDANHQHFPPFSPYDRYYLPSLTQLLDILLLLPSGV